MFNISVNSKEEGEVKSVEQASSINDEILTSPEPD
jgi:hypothetical protein